MSSLSGKTVVVTGATSGIGRVAAQNLAAGGARIVCTARDRARGEALLEALRRISPGVDHRVHYGDLSVLADMKRIGAAIAVAEPRIDILLNNAGAIFRRRQLTADGLERTFALNHLSYFAITLLVADRLRATAGARIVNTSSAAHRYGKLDFDDLQTARAYSPFKAYGRSKLCNILFTRGLSRRLAGAAVTANCFHPGFVATRFADGEGGVAVRVLRFLKLFALSPEAGARTMIHLATADAVADSTGLYFDKCEPVDPTPEARNEASAACLWEESEKLCGLRW